jgi:hypothetical protein
MMPFVRKVLSLGKAAGSSEKGEVKRSSGGPAPDCAIWHDIARALDTKGSRK